MTTTYSYSLDGEEYVGCFDSPESALHWAVDGAEFTMCPEEYPDTIYVAENIDAKAQLIEYSSLGIAIAVMERLEDDLSDCIVGNIDNVLELIVKDEPPSHARKQLGKEIIELVLSKTKLNHFGVRPMGAWKRIPPTE
jgi:hypothetical protein